MKNWKTRLLSGLMITVLLLGLLPAGALAADPLPLESGTTMELNGLTVTAAETLVEGEDYSYVDDTLTLKSNKPVTLSGATTQTRVVIEADKTANVTLDNLSILFDNGEGTSTAGTCAFEVEVGAICHLTLSGANTLKSGALKAGLQVQRQSPTQYKQAELHITGESTGSLNVTGGNLSAGIGGGLFGDCGKIIIHGGRITANGGGAPAGIDSGAGIGGGYGSDGHEIYIYGGEITATGGPGGAGIGGGYSKGGKITIAGGKVTANGGEMAAGIGAGTGANSGNITILITGGHVTATSTGDSNHCAIGIGGGGGGDITFDIQITGGFVQAITESSRSDSDGIHGSAIIQNAVVVMNNHDAAFNSIVSKDGTSGIVFNQDAEGKVFGNPTFSTDVEIPRGKTANIDNGHTVTVSPDATLTNGGIFNINGGGYLINDGAINNNGAIVNYGTFNNYGSFSGNPTTNFGGQENKPFTITFEAGADSDVTGIPEPATVRPGASYTIPSAPSRDGYFFKCWIDSGETVYADQAKIENITGDMTLTAQWLKKVTISFVNGPEGTATNMPDPVYGRADQTVPLPYTAPELTGYKFAGWYDAGLKITYGPDIRGFPLADRTEDFALVARWKRLVNVNLGGIVLTDKAYDGQPLAYTGAASGVYANDTTTRYTGAFDYQWYDSTDRKLDEAPRDAGTYTLKVAVKDEGFVGEGQLSVTIKKAPVTITADDKIAAVGDMAPDLSFTISGLAPSEALTREPSVQYEGIPDMTQLGETKITVSGAVAGDNYDIQHIDGKLTVGYRISFDLNYEGAKAMDDAYTGADGKLAALPTPTRSGYNFTGWFDAEEDGSKIAADRVFTGNDTLYGHWTVRSSESGGATTYPPTVTEPEGGSVTTSPKNPGEGDSVTIMPKPDEGYEVDEIIVTGPDGKPVEVEKKPDGTFTFTQPGGKVTIEVSYKPIGTSPVNPFIDVNQEDWFYEAVLWAVEQEITGGTSATTFSPHMSCTRAQMVTFLWRAAGSPKSAAANPFVDVNQGAYYYDAVLWAAEKGITLGTTADTFSPNAIVTRSQAVTFLWRTAGSPVVNYAMDFTDVDQNAYYAEAVRWAASQGITNGTSATTFSPEADCTRAQIVTFLHRNRA